MSRHKTLVLGSGISALAYLFYNPESFALAGDQVGGLFKQAADLGPQLIWATPSTKRFLSDLGFEKQETRTVLVGYYFNNRLWSQAELEREKLFHVVKDLYSQKTRGTPARESHMSSGQGEFEVFRMTVQELVDTLLQRVRMRLIPEKATHIDLYNGIAYTIESEYSYNTLVSTVPAPILLDLIGKREYANGLLAYDKVYQKASEEDGLWRFEKDAATLGYDYVYVIEGHDFHRTRIFEEVNGNHGVVREYTLTPSLVDRLNGIEAGIPTGLIQKKGQIVSGHEVLRELPPSVELYGRYSEWKHSVRLEHVLEALQS